MKKNPKLTNEMFCERPMCSVCNKFRVGYYKGDMQKHCCRTCWQTNGVDADKCKGHSRYCEFRGGDGNNWDETTLKRAQDSVDAQAEASRHRSRSPRHGEQRQPMKRYVYTFGINQWRNWHTHGQQIFRSNPRLQDSEICIDASKRLGDDYEQSVEHSWEKDGRYKEVQAQLKQKPEFYECVRKVQAFLVNPCSTDTLAVTSDWGRFLSVAVVDFAVWDLRSIDNLEVEVCHIELEENDNRQQQAIQWLQSCSVP